MDFLSVIDLPNFADPQIWISLLTLTFLEIVLGVDNIIFISIISDKLPKEKTKLRKNIVKIQLLQKNKKAFFLLKLASAVHETSFVCR